MQVGGGPMKSKQKSGKKAVESGPKKRGGGGKKGTERENGSSLGKGGTSAEGRKKKDPWGEASPPDGW